MCKELTEKDVLSEIAEALGLELSEKSTLNTVRIEILDAIDRLEKESQCLRKTTKMALRTRNRFRSKSCRAKRFDLTFGTL